MPAFCFVRLPSVDIGIRHVVENSADVRLIGAGQRLEDIADRHAVRCLAQQLTHLLDSIGFDVLHSYVYVVLLEEPSLEPKPYGQEV